MNPIILTIIIWTVAIMAAIYISLKVRDEVSKLLKEKGLHLDYGLASKEEVLEKFGQDVGTVILEERRIVFWKFGWLWSVIGIVTYTILKAIIG